MDTSLDPPSLSYPQLFSFQVSYTSRSDCRNSIIPEGSKKGEWRHGILEVDFPMETFFLQDRDRIFLSQTFSSFNKHAEVNSSDDCSLSLIFNSDQWEVAAQNIAEKVCLQHLLECIVNNSSIDDVLRIGKDRDIVGLEKSVIKHGRVQRKAVNQKRLDERYLVLCPGKLFVFKNFDIKGKHVRYVTSVLGATVRMLSEEHEFQILAPGSKTITLIPQSQDDLTSWVDALAISIGHTKQVEEGSESPMKEEEKKSEIRLCKDQMEQRTSVNANQCVTLTHNEGETSRPSQRPHTTEEIGQSRVEPRSDSVALNILSKNKAGWDANESSQEVQSTPPKSKQAYRQEDKENRDVRKPCLAKKSNSKQSRAMMYLENALDEMAVIVGSIRTTRRLTGSRCFEMNDIRGSKTAGMSPLRSSWDFDWRSKEEQSWKGKGAYTERRWREREQPLSPGQATRTRRNEKVPRLDAWKQPIVQINKSWQSNKTLDKKSRELKLSSQLRHSVDSTAFLNRNRDLPGLRKYANSHQEQPRERKNSSIEAWSTYSGAAFPSAAGASTANARSSSKIHLTPATENLLKRCSTEVTVPNANSLGRVSPICSVSGFLSRDADSRQTLTQQVSLQQHRKTDNSTCPYVGTTSSTSEDEEDEEEDIEDDDGKGNENHSSRSLPHAFSIRGSNKDSALLDGYSRVQDGASAPEHIQSRRISTDFSFSRRGETLDQMGSRMRTNSIPNQYVDSFNRYQNEVRQESTTRCSAQQSLGDNCSKPLYGASEDFLDPELNYSERYDVHMQPTTPNVREEAQSTPTVFTSCIKANRGSPLEDPIYDRNFTGPQIINRRQSRLAHHDTAFHVSSDSRKSHENVGLRHSSVDTHSPDLSEATAATHYAYRSSRNELSSNVCGDERKSPCRGQDGADVSAQNSPNLRSLYHRQQESDLARQSESSESFVLSQQRQPMPDDGLLHANELPELVNRISKITAAIDGRDQQGYGMAHEGAAANMIDRRTPGHSDTTTYNMPVAGQETIVDPYQRAVKGLPLLNNSHLVSMTASQQPSLASGSRHLSDDPINFNGADSQMRWSSADTLTSSRDPRLHSQRQSYAEDRNTMMGSLESSMAISERRP